MNIYVCCPANHTTGGPEALHQLVDALRRQGHEAFISYFPLATAHSIPPEYDHYSVVGRQPEDATDNVIVVPETMTYVLRQYPQSKRIVWWLSVDFYFGWEHRSRIVDRARYLYRRATNRCVGLSAMGDCYHAAQSRFAQTFLQELGIRAFPLSDYLSEQLLLPSEKGKRSRIVLYNPRKGMHVTKTLMEACPELNFRALVGLSRAELRDMLGSSMIYMDFGHHPGKDRMPREAAASGCVVITNRRGSAGYFEDVPIPERYKIDDTRRGFRDDFRGIVNAVLGDFQKSSAEFEAYVSHIKEQERVFFAEAAALPVRLAESPFNPGLGAVSATR